MFDKTAVEGHIDGKAWTGGWCIENAMLHPIEKIVDQVHLRGPSGPYGKIGVQRLSP